MQRLIKAGAACLACVAIAWPEAGHATDRALLIGVSDYPALPKRLWLRGPVNDVALMRDTLLARRFKPEAIRVLSSRSTPDDEPTRSHILQAMQALQQQVQAGDRVVLYLAGHGSQQPQPAQHGSRPTEPDGLDEVFLPADVQQWDGSGAQAAIPNALLDDEIGEWIDALVDRGATVWAVFDTCHAAGIGRGPGRSSHRALAPAELGVPIPKAAGAARLTHAVRPAPPMGRSDGRLLLHAARAHELTGEEWLPRGAPMLRSRMHGVFTFHLTALWRGPQAMDAALIESSIREVYRSEGRAQPQPTVVGDRRLMLP